MMFRLLSSLLLLRFLALGAAAGAPAIEFRDGDRVVFIGNTFVERCQSYGHLETWLTTALADRHLTFRNLGWSGDTVHGHARSYFGPPEEGLDRLRNHLETLQPTLIISVYGAVAAFEGEPGLESFLAGYRNLLEIFRQQGARIVLMSPPPAENLPAPLPNQDAHNERLARYTEAIRALAKSEGCAFADLFSTLKEAWPTLPHPLTDNGLHFTETGYAAITPLIARSLGVDPAPPTLTVEAANGVTDAKNLNVESLSAGPEAVTVRFQAANASPQDLTLKITGLREGTYRVQGERPLLTAPESDLAEGISLPASAWHPSLQELRQAILRKNELFFHRWRPQNETYLFGFRKHEQGNNAVEIPQFEPLIQEQEARIQTLKTPPPVTLTITSTNG